MDEDEDLVAAIALSQQGGPPAAPDGEPEPGPELSAALALSSVNNGLRHPPPAPAAPAPAPSGAQEALGQRVRDIFQETRLLTNYLLTTFSPTHLLTCALTHLLTYALTHLRIYALTHLLTCPLTHLLTHWLTS